jgi:alkylhydroperoxidase family enzyme
VTTLSQSPGQRIRPLDHTETSGSVAEILEASKLLSRDGEPINIFRTLAHHGRALKHSFNLGGAFMFGGNLPGRVREIVILRVARNTRCEYEYAQHLVIGQQNDLSREEIESLVRPELGDGWSEAEHAVITAVDQLCQADDIDDPAWAELERYFDDTQLVELLMLTGYYRMLAGFLNAARVEIDAGLEGWPEGAPSAG